MNLALTTLVITIFIVTSQHTHASNAYQDELSLIASGHPAQAYSQLRPKLLASAGSPEFDSAFGLAALDNGAPAEAITAFERVLAQQPENLEIRTELARAYAELGDTAAAKRELDTVKHSSAVPKNIRDNISHYANTLDTALNGGPGKITATLTASTGFDSNINTATTSSYLIVPSLAALGPARLANGAQAKGSIYSDVGATLTAIQPLTFSKSIFVTASTNTKTSWENSEYNQTNLSAEGGLQVLTPDYGTFTLGLTAQQFWFGGDAYTTTLATTGAWKYTLDDTSNITTYSTLSHIIYDENSAQNANRAILGTSLDTRWHIPYTPYTFAGIYGGTERTEKTSSSYLSHNLIGFQAGTEVFASKNLSFFFDSHCEIRNYDTDYPLFLKSRLDHQLDIATGTAYALTPTFSLRPTVSYRYASSNIGFYDYQRWLANINLRYTF